MANPKIVVAIVSYKSAELTIRCLLSVAAERQSANLPLEVIVVDNASGDFDDLSRAIQSNDWKSWVTLILAPKNGGFGYGNNIAIRRAFHNGSPAYIYLLNPDTEVRPGAILSLVHFMDTHVDVGIVGSSFENADGSDWPIAFRFPSWRSELCQGLDIGFVSRLLGKWQVPRVMSKRAQPTDWVSGASMMVRSEVFKRIGGFDESYFLYFEETDFSRRAIHAGYPTWYFPKSRVMHHSGYSTHVTSHTIRKQRFPGYWFDSRRRYFTLTHGATQAKLIDAIAIVASSLGWLKRIIMRQRERVIPHLTRDLWRHSVLRRRNRGIAKPIIVL